MSEPQDATKSHNPRSDTPPSDSVPTGASDLAAPEPIPVDGARGDTHNRAAGLRSDRLSGAATTAYTPPTRLSELRVWAPQAHRLRLVVHLVPTSEQTADRHATSRHGADQPTETTLELEMIATDPTGWWHTDTGTVPPHLDSDPTAIRYGLLVDDATRPIPDPRSARQPDGVHGLSALHTVDPSIWHDADWSGCEVSGAVIYEMHIGTFTEAGTFDSAIERLDDLVSLGVDIVEPLPINAFNGTRNWGYDGVDWYAVQESYGGPDAFARFVDACHCRGLGVVLDVVYNHLGPSGNYLPDLGPYLGSAGTGWGASLNLDGPDSDEVRLYILENALRWFTEFHVDGLRLDAVHALHDARAVHILEALARATSRLSAELQRPLSLIAESDLNDPKLLIPRASGGYGLTAQWNDDIHHAVHTAVSGERQGYYADFGTFECLSKVLRGGFFHDGTYSSFRGRHHGRPIPHTVPTTALLAYTCNHDQIGNRAVGDRPSAYLDFGQLAIKAALVLLSPFTPMLFMGEEWAARTPFQFFTSHPEPELGKATARGRKAEFAAHGWNSDDVPDPQDLQTFVRSTLDWTERERPDNAAILDFYRDLITLRKQNADFTRNDFDSVAVDFDADAGWFALHRGRWSVIVVMGEKRCVVPVNLDVRLGWGEYSAREQTIELGGHSLAIGLRTEPEPR